MVVPLDGSSAAERALPSAAWFADRLGARLCLLSAVPDEREAPAREARLGAVRVGHERPPRAVVVDRDPARAIHRLLEQEPTAVVCMASSGRGRSAALVASVPTAVVSRAQDPAILVGPSIGDFAEWLERPLLPQWVIACVDDSPASAELLPIAVRWARWLDEPLVVTTVAETVPPGIEEGVPVRRRFGPDGDADAFLERLVEPLRADGLDVTTHALYDPVGPALRMLTYLREHPAALVLVRSHARRGVSRLVFGDVAATIVHGSPAPVLVVPRPDAGPPDRPAGTASRNHAHA
jgi:nucleotide-binding universal stress UspA family protein